MTAPGDAPDEVLATITRSATEQDRIAIATFNGCRFISIRGYAQSASGEWHPMPRRGWSVRLRDLGAVISALITAQRMTGADPAPRASGGDEPAPEAAWLTAWRERRQARGL